MLNVLSGRVVDATEHWSLGVVCHILHTLTALPMMSGRVALVAALHCFSTARFSASRLLGFLGNERLDPPPESKIADFLT